MSGDIPSLEPPSGNAWGIRRGAGLPRAASLCLESSLDVLEDPETSVKEHFVRSHFPPPALDGASWNLSVTGRVQRPVRMSRSQLGDLPHREVTVLLECAGNGRSLFRPPTEGVRWGNGAVGVARWRGVALSDLLEAAGPLTDALEVVLEGADHGWEAETQSEQRFAMSIPIGKARDPDTVVAFEMNGEPLRREHGYPARAIVPGWYGMASVKWLTDIRVVAAPFQGHYRASAYAFVRAGDGTDAPKPPVTTLKVKSLITWPAVGQVLSPGTHVVRGAAWTGTGRVSAVDVSTRFGAPSDASDAWRSAQLVDSGSVHGATRWTASLQLTRPGYYVLRARARDTEGNVQPAQAEWNYRGVANNSIHAVPFEIRELRS